MKKEPQKILLIVMCSERLPSEEGVYETSIGDRHYSQKYVSFIDGFGNKLCPSYWYEPATRIVLTVEEYERLKERHKQLGYLEAREDMDDEREVDELY